MSSWSTAGTTTVAVETETDCLLEVEVEAALVMWRTRLLRRCQIVASQ